MAKEFAQSGKSRCTACGAESQSTKDPWRYTGKQANWSEWMSPISLRTTRAARIRAKNGKR